MARLSGVLVVTLLILGCFAPVFARAASSAGESGVRPGNHEARLAVPSRLVQTPAIVQVPAINPGEYFLPPEVTEIPDSKYGDMVRLGRDIFIDTQGQARRYVGNGLNCSNCHLNEGRKPYAAPLWAAYPMYPAARVKTQSVQTFQERIQDCFRYSMNGIAPTLDAPELKALVAYAHWLSKGAPVRADLPGRGFARLAKQRDPSPISGEILYSDRCASCHGRDGLGQKLANGRYQFPPLWGGESFNRAAGMNRVKTCAQFVKANMPLGQGWTLSDMESWDICAYIWVQDRPWDPRRSALANLFTEPVGR